MRLPLALVHDHQRLAATPEEAPCSTPPLQRRGRSAPSRTPVCSCASYRRDPTPQLRGAMVERFMPLARHLAARYARSSALDHLVQVASVGLLKAIDRFDPERGLAFSSFAVPTITGELQRYFRDHGWAVRVPRDLQERALLIDRTSEQLTRSLGRAPTPAEPPAALEIDVVPVLEALQTGNRSSPRPARRARGRGRREHGPHARHAGKRRGRVRQRRGRRHAGAIARAAQTTPATRPAAAVRGGSRANRDRHADRRLPDAGLADSSGTPSSGCKRLRATPQTLLQPDRPLSRTGGAGAPPARASRGRRGERQPPRGRASSSSGTGAAVAAMANAVRGGCWHVQRAGLRAEPAAPGLPPLATPMPHSGRLGPEPNDRVPGVFRSSGHASLAYVPGGAGRFPDETLRISTQIAVIETRVSERRIS